MRLKQVKLAGFKSFVDPTTVTLLGNRCAVVGPNGCGKSNIIDAVRWVMGESSAKQLRGENLTDVIFNGSSARKPTAVASIELIFDNSDGRIGGEYAAYAEISIRRQVTREAQSNYFLNGNKCRRRDIQDIFLGTGFGPRSYSIIEQGMISQLVEAKPEELRVYLEEAAGISKYKERRRETENRIRHTRENLERINDIREELGRQLDRLQRQSQAAEKYREFRAEEALLTAQLYTLRYQGLRRALSERERKIGELEIELERALADQRHVEAQIEQSRAAHNEESEKLSSVQETYYQLGADVARIEEAIQFNQARSKQLQEDLASASERLIETTRQLSMDEQQIQTLDEQINTMTPQVDQLKDKDEAAQQALQAVEQAMREWQVRWDEFNTQAAQHERQADVQGSRIKHLQQLLQRLRGRLAELESQQAEQPATGDDEVVELAAAISSLEDESRLAEAKIDECLKELAAAREDVLLRDSVLEEARGDVQAMRHDLAALQAVQEAALGLEQQEAETWLTENGLEQAPRLGEHLAVVPGWERAVETVLGHFLRALQVPDLAAMADALQGLTQGELTLVSPGSEADVELNPSISLPTLQSLLRGDERQTGTLLQGVYAAESVEVALQNRIHLLAGESIVTRQGFWVGPDWLRVINAGEARSGIIERGQEIETLQVRVEEAEAMLTDLQRNVQAGRSRVEQLEAQREELQQAVNSVNQRLGAQRTAHGVTEVKIREADARRVRLQKETADIQTQIEQEQNALSVARQELVAAETAREAHAELREGLAAERSNLEAAVNTHREQARAQRDEFHAMNGQLQSLQSRLSAGRTARDRLVEQQANLERQQNQLRAGLAETDAPLPDLQRELEEKLSARVQLEEQLNEKREQLNLIEQQTRQLEEQRGQHEAKVGKIREGLEKERVERQGMAVQETNLLEQLAATGHTLEEVQAGMPEEAEEGRWSEDLERLARRIQRLGPINLAAIDEFEQESERKVYLDTQALDLESALETLTDAIQKIDKETRSRFKDTFEAVNTRLGELFPKVFGGGHAYLELTWEDLLDTGVSLMARPPGKRNASVHLLSGGEKAMTAVALIFAIFHLNPSPVCLLDEVDAPLDDANVSRFASLIKEMSEDVQFLVITHNKITMEMADYLMGVTMQEAGVSRLVSVDVDEAAAMAVS